MIFLPHTRLKDQVLRTATTMVRRTSRTHTFLAYRRACLNTDMDAISLYRETPFAPQILTAAMLGLKKYVRK